MEDEKVQVNVEMDKTLRDDLDKMVKDDESDRSKFIRRLIRQESARRSQLVLPGLVEEKAPAKGRKTADRRLSATA
jgi:metal-responsive CopG/Arc/MetJ family transcriptional regulator